MPIARPVLERLLETAKLDRDAAAARVKSGAPQTCPLWRNADARYRQLVRRLSALGAVEKRDQDLREKAAAE